MNTHDSSILGNRQTADYQEYCERMAQFYESGTGQEYCKPEERPKLIAFYRRRAIFVPAALEVLGSTKKTCRYISGIEAHCSIILDRARAAGYAYDRLKGFALRRWEKIPKFEAAGTLLARSIQQSKFPFTEGEKQRMYREFIPDINRNYSYPEWPLNGWLSK